MEGAPANGSDNPDCAWAELASLSHAISASGSTRERELLISYDLMLRL